jgi:hypothetical protein
MRIELNEEAAFVLFIAIIAAVAIVAMLTGAK